MPILINLLAVVLTVMVLSRIFGDNPLYRTAQYVFVGASLGIAVVVSYHQVLRPAFVQLITLDPTALVNVGVPLLLGLMLLPRIARGQQLSWIANIPLALVFGIGAALAVIGALTGTLVPQIIDTARPLTADPAALLGTIVLVLGTIVVLASFAYTSRRAGPPTPLRRVVTVSGHWLLMIAFGFFFAGAVQTYLSSLVSRAADLLRLFGLTA
jgi:hypothetical protein